jgi:hypothetical protein
MNLFPRGGALQFIFIAVIGAALIAIFFLSVKGKQRPPWAGRRAASKTEYDSAKEAFLLQTSSGAYAITGHWWRRHHWYCQL